MFAIGTTLVLAAQDAFNLSPNQSEAAKVIPLTGKIVNTKNGLAWIALIAAIAGLLISAALWAVGSYSNNFQQTVNGKRGVVVALVAALIIGLAPAIMDFLYNIGNGSTSPPNP